MNKQPISLTVNGRAVGPYEIPDGLSMNDFLREYLNLTGTKVRLRRRCMQRLRRHP
jgi:aerobic-type carbon monoxide dehydrogenase small subunit (CoxS/CutS family)